jgi:type II secretory pathway pseudopilin PulG
MMVLNIHRGNKHSQKGIAYLSLLVLITIMSITIFIASENLSQKTQRERESQLLFIGEAFRDAIESYYTRDDISEKNYPQTIEQLLADNRGIKFKRHLRQIYYDPFTNETSWGLIKDEKHRIIGIHSLSNQLSIKTKFIGSGIVVEQFTKPLRYSDIKFIFTPEQ